MKNWQETEQIFSRLALLRDQHRPAALAVIIAVQGSTYRGPGAKLLIEEDGAMTGNVSGGCLEEDVRAAGREAMKSGKTRLVHYDTSDDEDTVWGLGLGCNGEVDLLIVPAISEALGSALDEVRQRLRGDESFAMVIGAEPDNLPAAPRIVDAGSGDGRDESLRATQRWLASGRSGLDLCAGRRCFVDVLVPPPHLVLCGAGEDAWPLASWATAAGFRVTVVDHRSAHLDAHALQAVFARVRARPEQGMAGLPHSRRTYVVVKTHTLRHDTEWVRQYLGTEVPYIGLLGPRARRDAILAAVPERARSRVYGPVGLDLGGEGAEQIALSVLAEVLAVHSGREPEHLRDCEGRIYQP